MGRDHGLDPIIAQAVGAGDEVGVSRGLQRGLMLAVALSILATAVMLPVETVLHWLGQPPDVVPVAALFARISIPGIFPLFAFLVFRQTLQAQHHMRPIVITIVAANVLNAFLDWVLIFGHLDFLPVALGVRLGPRRLAVGSWRWRSLALVGRVCGGAFVSLNFADSNWGRSGGCSRSEVRWEFICKLNTVRLLLSDC